MKKATSDAPTVGRGSNWPMETALHLAAVPVSADTERPMEGKRMRLDYVDTLRDLASAQVLLSHSMLAFFSAQARRPHCQGH